MSDLQNQTPANTYKGLLQVDDYTNGVNSTAKYVSDGEGTNSALSISESKVGVGTTSPSAELDVNGNVVADEYALDQTGSSSSAVAIHAPATNELAIRTNSTTAMLIDSNGRVGIGISIPISLLEVVPKNNVDANGDTTDASFFRVFDNATSGLAQGRNGGVVSIDANYYLSTSDIFSVKGRGQDKFIIKGDGNVGINTDSPSAPLEVVSTTGGVIMPRMNNSQRNAISSPTDGEMIFNNETNKLNVYNGTEWRELTDTAV